MLMIIHTKGKYAVLHGSYETLKPQCDAITDRGIGATIEVMAVNSLSFLQNFHNQKSVCGVLPMGSRVYGLNFSNPYFA